ncbi:uncharacterized protein LOC5513327 isoform X2 [Nematostella vectensis]|uniref:uncharacterized protein LOC5513327 isoform X2 n=1 Tax=Nematostella vectensis TaxID=45351 RepID=UPI0020777BEA|nr:uncharacterized protein LOC5513327 isoform X2 [Nematostella vectensis]
MIKKRKMDAIFDPNDPDPPGSNQLYSLVANSSSQPTPLNVITATIATSPSGSYKTTKTSEIEHQNPNQQFAFSTAVAHHSRPPPKDGQTSHQGGLGAPQMHLSRTLSTQTTTGQNQSRSTQILSPHMHAVPEFDASTLNYASRTAHLRGDQMSNSPGIFEEISNHLGIPGMGFPQHSNAPVLNKLGKGLNVQSQPDQTDGTYQTLSNSYSPANQTNGTYQTLSNTYSPANQTNGTYQTHSNTYSPANQTDGTYQTLSNTYSSANQTDGTCQTLRNTYSPANQTNGTYQTLSNTYSSANQTDGTYQTLRNTYSPANQTDGTYQTLSNTYSSANQTNGTYQTLSNTYSSANQTDGTCQTLNNTYSPASTSRVKASKEQIISANSSYAEIVVSNPKPEYDKYQKKYTDKNRRPSEQRVQDGKVQLKITSHKFPLSIEHPVSVFIRREPQAARKVFKERPDLFMRENEYTELKEVHVNWMREPSLCAPFHYKCSVNLDSVYLSTEGKEVYRLVKAKGPLYNRFQLITVLQYQDGHREKLTPYEFVLKSARTVGQNSSRLASDSILATTNRQTNVVCDFLKANIAEIKKIDYEILETKQHDIAYYYMSIRQSEDGSKRLPTDLERGDVVGFFAAADEGGETSIDYLTAENSKRACVAGVISRSAFLRGRKAICDPEKENADLVCIIGEVDVKVIGPVKTGELIYTSKSNQMPGTAVAYSQMEQDITATLLGMAMQESRDPDLKLVRCLVSIVLGISSKAQKQSLEEIHRMKEEMEKSFEDKVVKIQNCWKGFLCYMFLAPNSPYLIGKCEAGCIHAPNGKCCLLKLEYIPDESQEVDEIYGIRFKWDKLKRKLSLAFDKYPNSTGFRYYLNKNRCVTGSIRAISSWLDPAPRVPRVNVLAVDVNCTMVYYHSNSRGWIHYNPKRLKVVKCARVHRHSHEQLD